jgi:NADPH-dependent 2,4-dienoyl-CoA reductase/sulfur reductase-like enzyme/phenylpropionate dioxygenase-like ring-hydroxylating dioxygenase large terminal subunit
MAWRKVIALEDLAPEGVKGVEIDGTPVALYRLGGGVFATHGICTHALAFLADGYVEDGKIECPLHQGLFDIRSGKALCAPVTQDLVTYAVKVEGDVIFVDLDARREGGTEGQQLPRLTLGSPPPCDSVVIVGAGQAAAAAIRSLRESGFAGSIDLVGREPHLPYERPPLSKDVLLGKALAESCARLSEADVASLNVTVHRGCSVTRIDPKAATVGLSDGRVLRYGALLLATGGTPRRLRIPGADLPGVHYLRTIEDANAIRKSLATAKRLVIVGGGFIGLELASVAAALGVSAVILERESEVMARVLPPSLGSTFRSLAERHGVSVRLGVDAEAIHRDGERLAVRTSAGPFDADAVCIGVGLVPEIELATAAGCEVDGGIVVDAEQRTSVAGIWAAGDCALHHAPVRGHRRRLESWHSAEQQGAAAGRSIAGAAPVRDVQTPWFWTDQFGLNIQILGVSAPGDRVALTGADGEEGAVYRTIDPATGRLTSVIAFSDPSAIRQARKEFDSSESFDIAKVSVTFLAAGGKEESTLVNEHSVSTISKHYVWPAEGLTRVPDWVYTDDYIYQREVERIFHGRTWNYVALEGEIPNAGDFIRSNVGPTPIVVSRAEDGTINVFENRCAHRAAEFCRELSGNAKEFVCPYHQWSYDLKGNLAGVPFRRGVDGKGGMPASFKPAEHGLRRLKVTTHRGVVFASYCEDMEPLAEYLGPEILLEFEATFDGRRPKVLGHYRHSLPGNWKLYHENLKDPYHATLLHTFLVTFGLLVAGNKSSMIADASGRHGVMASAKSDASKLDSNTKKEMRAYKEGMKLEEPRFMEFVSEFDSPWSVTMTTIWPNLIVQREMNTLGVRQIIPTGPNEFIMKWTMFGFEGDDEEMTRHRLRQGNLMGPAGFLGLEDNEAIKFVQDGMLGVPDGQHVVELDPGVLGTADTLISEASIRAMYQHWRSAMEL